MIIVEASVIVIGYLLGSIPSAYIAGRLIKGVDIRQVGGGNVGALNTVREIGPAAGVAVLIVDIAKGSLTVLIAQWLGASAIFVFIAGFAAVVGHIWPVFLKFRGGRGAATTFGVLLVLVPLQLLIGLTVVIIVVLITSNIVLGLSTCLTLLPLIIWLFDKPLSLVFYTLVLGIFLGLRYFPTARRALSRASSKKDFIFDRQFKPWQTKRKEKKKQESK